MPACQHSHCSYCRANSRRNSNQPRPADSDFSVIITPVEGHGDKFRPLFTPAFVLQALAYDTSCTPPARWVGGTITAPRTVLIKAKTIILKLRSGLDDSSICSVGGSLCFCCKFDSGDGIILDFGGPWLELRQGGGGGEGEGEGRGPGGRTVTTDLQDRPMIPAKAGREGTRLYSTTL